MVNDKKNISTPQSLPSDFSSQALADEKRHKEADEDDQSGELDPLGEDQDNEPLDIDEARKVMDLNTKDAAELNSTADLDADENNG